MGFYLIDWGCSTCRCLYFTVTAGKESAYRYVINLITSIYHKLYISYIYIKNISYFKYFCERFAWTSLITLLNAYTNRSLSLFIVLSFSEIVWLSWRGPLNKIIWNLKERRKGGNAQTRVPLLKLCPPLKWNPGCVPGWFYFFSSDLHRWLKSIMRSDTAYLHAIRLSQSHTILRFTCCFLVPQSSD